MLGTVAFSVRDETYCHCDSCGAIIPDPPKPLEPGFFVGVLALLFVSAATSASSGVLVHFGLPPLLAWVVAFGLVLLPFALYQRRYSRPRYRCHSCKHQGFYRPRSTPGEAEKCS